MENNKGYLEIIIGPMFSGKTSELLNLYKKYNFCKVKTIVINYAGDTRYSSTCLATHDGIEIPCRYLEKLSDLIQLELPSGPEPPTPCRRIYTPDQEYKNRVEFDECEVILINEAQFFVDVVEWVKIAVEKHNKKVFVCGLDSDFKRNKFGNWLDLIPLCDKIKKLKAICCQCKKNYALFTHRIGNKLEQKLIGTECYIPLCRYCFLSTQ